MPRPTQYGVGPFTDRQTDAYANNRPGGLYVPAADLTVLPVQNSVATTYDVAVVDHATGAVTQVTVRPNPIGTDTHGVMAIVQTTDGHLHLFGGSHSDPMLYSRSVRPHDPTEWEHRDNWPNNVKTTYPVIWTGPDNRMMASFRRINFPNVHENFDGPHPLLHSADGGATWTYGTDLINDADEDEWYKTGRRDPATGDWWFALYLKWSRNNDSKGALRNYTTGGNTWRKQSRTNVYVVRYSAARDRWEDVAGNPLTLPLTKSYMDSRPSVLVMDSVALSQECNQCHVRVHEGVVHAVWLQGYGSPNPLGVPGSGDVMHSYWTGSAWTTPVAVAPSNGTFWHVEAVSYGGHLDLFHTEHPGGHLLHRRWTGAEWEVQGRVWTAGEGEQAARPTTWEGAHPDARLSWIVGPNGYGSVRDSFLWGRWGLVGTRTYGSGEPFAPVAVDYSAAEATWTPPPPPDEGPGPAPALAAPLAPGGGTYAAGPPPADTTGPRLAGLSVTSPSPGVLRVEFESDEPLAEITVTRGASGGDLVRADFTETST